MDKEKIKAMKDIIDVSNSEEECAVKMLKENLIISMAEGRRLFNTWKRISKHRINKKEINHGSTMS